MAAAKRKAAVSSAKGSADMLHLAAKFASLARARWKELIDKSDELFPIPGTYAFPVTKMAIMFRGDKRSKWIFPS